MDNNGAGGRIRHLPAERGHSGVTQLVPIEPEHTVPAPRAFTPQSDWERYVTSAGRHKLIVLFVTLLGAGGGLVAAHYLRPQYVAKSVLWIEHEGEAPRERAATTAERVVDASSWYELVTSNAVLDSVVRSLRLYVHPRTPADSSAFSGFEVRGRVHPGDYRLSLEDDDSSIVLRRKNGEVVGRGVVGDSIGHAVGFSWTPPRSALRREHDIEFTVQSPYDAVADLAEDLRPKVDMGGSFLRMELRGSDPARTTQTVNAVSERAVKVAAALKRQRLQELEGILGGHYRHVEGELASAERALAAFQTNAVSRLEGAGASVLASERREGTIDPLLDLRLTLDDTRRDRNSIDAILNESRNSPIRIEALSVIPSVSNSPRLKAALDEAARLEGEMRALEGRYTAESAPVVKARVALEELQQRSIPALLRQLSTDLSRREEGLAPRVDAAFAELRAVPPRRITEARLARNVASAEALRANVGERYETTRLSLLSSLPDLHVFDVAVQPQTPTVDFRPLVVILAVVTSFGLGVMGVTVRERMDTRIRHPDQVTEGMQLNILGCVPRVGWRGLAGGTGESLEVIESLRALRVRLLQARTSGPLCLTITSPSVGEGKSFMSVNLALSFAHAGYRTILIDGDVRRGAQHRVLGVAPRPGLTDVLAGEVTLDTAVQPTQHAGLSLIAAGSRTPRAPELLLAPTLSEIVNTLRSSFDVIIVDSPPLSAGVDSLVLAAVTTNLLLVLRSGSTDLPLALAKLEVADAHPVRLVGAVLNDVKSQGDFRYYTYDLSGYGPEEDGKLVAGDWRRVLGGRS